MKAQGIAVVLVTFNRLDKLKTALACYEKQTYPIVEMLVVNNCSTDGTGEYLDEWVAKEGAFNRAVLHLSENTGGAGGFGNGMDTELEKVKDGRPGIEWILVADDDAFPEPDAIQKMVEYYEGLTKTEQAQVSVLCSAVINQGKRHLSHRSRLTAGLFRARFSGVPEAEYAKEAFEIDTFSYVGTMMKVQALLQAGTTNRELFIYGDDNEHSMRLKKTGKLVCVTGSRYIHNTPGMGDRTIGWHTYYDRRNQLYLLKKYLPIRYFYFRLIKQTLLETTFLSKNTKEERKLFRAAFSDALHERLGKHPIYRPGFHF